MIRVEDLMEAIAECEGTRNPSSTTCIKLAAYYTILNHMNVEKDEKMEMGVNGYSFAPAPALPFSDSRFSRLVQDKGIEKCFPVLDEAMDVLMVVNTRLYNNIVRRLEDI